MVVLVWRSQNKTGKKDIIFTCIDSAGDGISCQLWSYYDQFFAIHMYKIAVRETLYIIWKFKMNLSNKNWLSSPFK